ncbi:MAG: SH3 domain-containing protein [Bacteroidota bacterium]
MTRAKKSYLPSIEMMIIIVFFGCFILWAIKQCNDTQQQYQTELELEVSEEEGDAAESEMVDTIANPATPSAGPTAATDPSAAAGTAAAPSATQAAGGIKAGSTSDGARLYVTIDGLKLRTGPSLDSPVILTIPLFNQVTFLGEITDSTQKINLGMEIADEPWVKVRHRRGHEGWVYGAGVHYARIKRKGVR